MSDTNFDPEVVECIAARTAAAGLKLAYEQLGFLFQPEETGKAAWQAAELINIAMILLEREYGYEAFDGGAGGQEQAEMGPDPRTVYKHNL